MPEYSELQDEIEYNWHKVNGNMDDDEINDLIHYYQRTLSHIEIKYEALKLFPRNDTLKIQADKRTMEQFSQKFGEYKESRDKND